MISGMRLRKMGIVIMIPRRRRRIEGMGRGGRYCLVGRRGVMLRVRDEGEGESGDGGGGLGWLRGGGRIGGLVMLLVE